MIAFASPATAQMRLGVGTPEAFIIVKTKSMKSKTESKSNLKSNPNLKANQDQIYENEIGINFGLGTLYQGSLMKTKSIAFKYINKNSVVSKHHRMH